MEAQDRFTRAYARLTGLQTRIEKCRGSLVPESFVKEYHEALDHLEASGFDVDEFKVKPEQVWKSRWYGRVANRILLLAKLDGVLTYFGITMAPPGEPQKQLGFHAPAK